MVLTWKSIFLAILSLSFSLNFPIVTASVVLLIMLCVFVYAASFPIPPGLPQPWLLRFNVVAYKIAEKMGKNLFEVLASLYKTSNRKITNTLFDRVPVRIYEPPNRRSGELLPAVVYMHGGGFQVLNVDTLHPFTDDLATQLDIIVISIEYRLSGEAIFPAAIDDCTKATVWFLDHTKDYNVNKNKIAIMGESAGGNLAAGVTQRLTFDPQYGHLPKLRLQVLICPMLQALDFNTPSYQQYDGFDTTLLLKSIVVNSWCNYVTGSGQHLDKMCANMHTSSAASLIAQKGLSHDLIPDRLKVDPYKGPIGNEIGDDQLFDSLKDKLLNPDLAPLMRDSLKGLPEAYIITCTYDVLRDDGILYAKKLESEGVKVTWVHRDDGIHAASVYCASGPFALKAGTKSRKGLIAFLNETLNT